MNPTTPPTTTPLSLENALWRPDTQRRIISRGADALHVLGLAANHEMCLVGTKPLPADKGIHVGGNAVSKCIASARNTSVPAMRPVALDRVAGFFQTVASTDRDNITRTWCVLAILLLLPRARADIKAASSVRMAPYFDGDGNTILGFDARLTTKLCGSRGMQAMSPVEIVVSEWQLLDFIRSRPQRMY
jgi:hypothetical protein